VILDLGLVTALVVVGLAAHSLAVFAAAADYLADAAAIGVSLLAIRRAARPRYPNATTVAALVMGAGALVLGGDAGDDDGAEDLNVKAVLLDTAADAAAAAGVAVSGVAILGAGGWYWIDPATALVIAVIVGYHALKLICTITLALRSPIPGLAPGSNPARHRHEDRQAGGRTDLLRLTGDARSWLVHWHVQCCGLITAAWRAIRSGGRPVGMGAGISQRACRVRVRGGGWRRAHGMCIGRGAGPRTHQ
jgi:cobalt-zinc-cadmium efflux system protein